MTLTYPVGFFGSEPPSGGDATVFPSGDVYANFDGVNDYVDLGNLTSLIGGKSKVSISFWSNHTGSYAGGFFSNSSTMGMLVSWNGPPNNRLIQWNGGGARSTDNSFTTNTWHFTTLVFDGTGVTNDDRLKLYRGTTAIPLTYGSTIPATSTASVAQMFLGKYANGSVALATKMKDFRIYDDALTSDEITYLYTAGASGTDPLNTNLVGHWKLDEGEGTNVADSAGANDGTATNITESTFWVQE